MAKKRRTKYEFKPDRKQITFFKRLYLTRLQRKQLLKWFLHAALCVLMLVIQDTMMSRIRISGATTDLAVCAIFLIGIYEGTENGSLFTLIASIIYLFSGSAPGPYCIGLLTCLTVGANLIRQVYWRRSFGSTILCTGMSIILYEMGTFLMGIFTGLTIWPRAGVFFLTALLTCLVMLPLYPLVRRISKIGGETWKE